MNPFIFFTKPTQKIPVGGLKADKSITAPEPFTNKTVWAFNLSLDPGSTSRSHLRFNPMNVCQNT
jgi:hypothetical protein